MWVEKINKAFAYRGDYNIYSVCISKFLPTQRHKTLPIETKLHQFSKFVLIVNCQYFLSYFCDFPFS